MKDLLKKISQALASIGLIFVVAMLGSVAGQGPKWLRRFILPAVVTLYAISIVQNWWVLTIYCMSGIFSIGYGRKDEFDLKPSFLGKIAYKLFPHNAVLQDVMIRGIVGKLIALSMLSVPIITGNWLSYAIGSWVIIFVWAMNSWRGYGEIPITLFGKTYNLLKVDLVTYAVTSCGIILIINGFLG